MTGNEFKKCLNKYLNDDSITVAEYRELGSTLKNTVIETVKSVLSIDDHLIPKQYNHDSSIPRERVNDVEFNQDDVKIIYWDDGWKETTSLIRIPLDDIVRWIDGDTSDIKKRVIEDIRSFIKSEIENDEARIKHLEEIVNSEKDLLYTIDEMSYDEIRERFYKIISGDF